MQKRRLATCLVAALLVLVLSAVSPAARADVITDWNETGVTAVVAGGLNGLAMSRAMAMIHAAMHDAVNGVERRYTSYGADIKAPPGASREAAASAAAYTVLSRLLWLQTPVFDAMRGSLTDRRRPTASPSARRRPRRSWRCVRTTVPTAAPSTRTAPDWGCTSRRRPSTRRPSCLTGRRSGPSR